MLSPGALPTAASVATIVDFDGVDLGLVARAPDPKTLGSAHGTNVVALRLCVHCDMTSLPEGPLDRLSDMESVNGTGGVHGASSPSQCGDLNNRHSMVDGSHSHPPTCGAVRSGTSESYPRSRTLYSEAWPRKTHQALSQMGSVAISATVKTLCRLGTIASMIHQSSHVTLHNVDKALILREQLLIVLLAAVFILYPSWAQAGGSLLPYMWAYHREPQQLLT